jgi:hypothetical protein
MRTASTSLACTLTILALATLSAKGTTYTDAVNDGALVGVGGGMLDITGAEVSNTASDLIFKINLNGDPVATDWGKYMIGISEGLPGDPAGNGWGRPIGLSAGGGMNYWLGSWADSGNGVQLFQYSGVWSQTGGAGPFAGGPALPGLSFTKDASSITITVPFAAMGLGVGSTFLFDAYSSGGGGTDGAIDALANPAQTVANWGDYYDSGNLVYSYTITEVPEPAACALLGLGALLSFQRFARRRS